MLDCAGNVCPVFLFGDIQLFLSIFLLHLFLQENSHAIDFFCSLPKHSHFCSGPVTGGVLRGEKGRFQLFGDTMNTAGKKDLFMCVRS